MAKRHLRKALLVIVVAAAPLAAFLVRADSPIPTKPIYTQYHTFRIPFRLDPSEAERLKTIELYVSKDQGQSWTRYQATLPSKRDFTYRSENDGEYWFGVRTIDRFNVAQPQETSDLTPGLKVIVDSQDPKIAMRTKRIGNDSLVVDWRVADPNADLGTLKIECRTAGNPSWQALKIKPARNGHVRWPVEGGSGVEIRARVRDLAGNAATAKLEAKAVSDVRVTSGAETNAPPPPTVSKTVSRVRSNQPVSLENRSEDDLARPSFDLPPDLPSFGEDMPVDTSEVPNSQATPSTDSAPVTELPQPVSFEGLHTVNAPRFTLDYQLDAVGPSGVGVVELWMTTDEGKSWRHYGEDQDRTSPFEVNVPGDGFYGFTLLARSGANLGPEPPRSGDSPQVRVLVDSTPPKARLLGAEVGKGEMADRVEIRWQAADVGLDEHPVALYYAEKLTGEWNPVATRLGNQGHYSWQVARRVPDRVFLRLEVRDRAGNVQVVDSGQPVTIDRSRPKGRILGVATSKSAPVRR